MRNDSILNTGINSASINKAARAKEARLLRQQEKEQKRAKLHPAAEVVAEEIRKEQEYVKTTLLSLINTATPEADVKSLIVSLNLYDLSMKSLKTRISNILRDRND